MSGPIPSFRRITGSERLLSALQLEEIELHPDAPEGSVVGRWRALGAAMPGAWWVFGGSVVAQAMLAAAASAPGRVPRMVSIRFLRQAEPGATVEHTVTRVTDSGTFSDRSVISTVEGRTIAATTVMLHRRDETPLGFHQPMPTVAAPGTTGTSTVAGFEFVDLCDPPMMTNEVASSDMALWMRVPGTPRDDELLNAAALTMATDMFMAQSAWRPVDGYSIRDVDKVMSWGLSLTVWFHHPVTFDDWHLVVIDTPSAANGRSLGQNHWFDTAGTLVATTMLDSVMRLRRPDQASAADAAS